MPKVPDPIEEGLNRTKRNKKQKPQPQRQQQRQAPRQQAAQQELPAAADLHLHQYSDDDVDAVHYNVDDVVEQASDDDEPTEEQEEQPVEVSTQDRVRVSYLHHYDAGAKSRSLLLNRVARTLGALAEGCPASCPACASPTAPGGLTCPVTIVTWEQPITVNVTVSYCEPCRKNYNVLPVEMDCLPDSKIGWDLILRREHRNVLWWHQSVLQLYDLLSFRSRHLSADAFCSALLDSWERNGIARPSAVSANTLRQRLRGALLMYWDCQNSIEDFPEDAVCGWPCGATNGCPCCGDSVTCPAAPSGPAGVGTAGAGPAGEETAGEATTGEEAAGAEAAGAEAAGAEAAGEEAVGEEAAGEEAAGAGPAGVGPAGAGLAGAGTADTQAAGEEAAGAGTAGAGTADTQAAGEEAAGAGRAGAGTADTQAAGAGPAGAGPAGGGTHKSPAAAAEAAAAVLFAAAAAVGAAAVASEWLLRAAYGPEASGPGPSRLHSVHFDACFKLNLLACKGYLASYTQLSRRRFFLPNALVQEVMQDSTAAQQIGVTHCSNFNADKVLAAESRKNLITAVGAALCRHGMLMRLMNLFGGERHAYSTAAALSFLSAGTAVAFWWYDIACRWGKSYSKWLARQPSDLQLRGAGLRPLIPPWHRYAHSYACQKAFGHLAVRGVGQGTGEPAEIFNSVIGPHGGITQYMSPVNREAHLERVCRLHCQDVLGGLPSRQWRMRERAKAILASAKQRVSEVEAALADTLGCQVEEVRQRLQQPVDPAQLDPAPGATPAAEYARCRLALSKLQREDALDVGSDVVRLGLLFPGADNVPVWQRPALLRSIKEQSAELERSQQYNPAAWGPGSEPMTAALAELADSELRKLYVEVEDAVADVAALGYVMKKLAGRRHQQQLAIQEYNRARERAKQLWGSVVSWSAVPGAVAPEVRDALASSSALGKALQQQDFPWAPRKGPQGAARLEARWRRALEEVARCEEEIGLIREEVQRAVAYYTHRVGLVEEALRVGGAAGLTASQDRLLSLHLARHQRMLERYRVLASGSGATDASQIDDD